MAPPDLLAFPLGRLGALAQLRDRLRGDVALGLHPAQFLAHLPQLGDEGG